MALALSTAFCGSRPLEIGAPDTATIRNYSKKMISTLNRELLKIRRNLLGIRDMGRLPDALVIVDPKREHIAIKEAQKASMPKDTVERAIKRGSGESAEGQLEEVLYEGYGAHGVPVLVETLTDNKQRTVQDLRANCDFNRASFQALSSR